MGACGVMLEETIGQVCEESERFSEKWQVLRIGNTFFCKKWGRRRSYDKT